MLSTLNSVWQEYDKLSKKWGVYKVETIGDAYLGIVGCPERHQDHAVRAVDFALDIITMIKAFKTEQGDSLLPRIGINSGKVTAGVLGDMNPHW